MPRYTFRRCSLAFARVLQSDHPFGPVIVDVSASNAWSATVSLREGTWNVGVLKARYADDRAGPWTDFSTPIQFTAAGTTGLQAVEGRYIAFEATTLDADVYVDIAVECKEGGLNVTL